MSTGTARGLPFSRARQVDAAIAAVGARDYADAPVGLLSGGQQQRLLSLDPASQQSVTTLLNAYHREHGTTVVFVTHEITPVAGFIDRVLYIAGGRWAARTPDEVMTAEALSALYGTHIDVIRVHGRIVVVGGDDPAGRHHPDGGGPVHHPEHQPPDQERR